MRIEVRLPTWVIPENYDFELSSACARVPPYQLRREGGKPVDLQVTTVIETGMRMRVDGTQVPADMYVKVSAEVYKP